MKRLTLFLIMLLSLPIPAQSVPLGTGYIDLTYSGPTGGGYYLDYDGKVISSSFGYTTDWTEVFCVSGQNLHDATFKFYTITDDLDNYFGIGTFEKLSRAAWVADNWTNFIGSNDPDIIKGEAQKAVWKIMGVMDITGNYGIDHNIYVQAINQNPLPNYNWYFAYTPAAQGDPDYQDYLTPAPVPEPSTILLLGSGLLGYGLIRKRIRT